MSVDHYAGAARGWAQGAELVYGPIARELLRLSPHPLAGRTVLDVGAGTGVASRALAALGARPVAVDRSPDMLGWDAGHRPPAAVADVRALPLPDQSLDDTVAAFILNHLVDPAGGATELARVVRPGGALLACVYANASHSPVRDALDEAARQEGWSPPDWYARLKQDAVPLLGTAADMQVLAEKVGLLDVRVEERPVDVGVTTAEQLVDYRLGQAHFSAWVDRLGDEAAAVRTRLVHAIRPVMRPYQPVVVFLAATVP